MKKFWKEILILLLQLFLFYIFPLFAGPTDMMGMVVLILGGSLLLAFLFGLLSRWEWKWCWPGVVALLFAPTIFLYYNFTAFIHIMWYLVIAGAGMLLGVGIRKLFRLK